MKKLRYLWAPILIGLLLSFFLRLPYLHYSALSREDVNNLCVAENIASKKGFLLSIKGSYASDSPVVRHASGETGLVYPMFLAFTIRYFRHPQLINIFLSFVNSILLFVILRRAFNEKTAWLSLLFMLFHPRFNMSASYLTTFHMALTFVLASSVVMLSYRNLFGFFAAGIILGFSYWTEPWFIFSPLAFLPGIYWGEKSRIVAGKRILMILGGFVLSILPLLILSMMNNGFLISPEIAVFFRVADYNEYLWQSYGFELPSISQFISRNPGFIFGEIRRNLRFYLSTSFIAHKTWILLFCIPGLFMAGRKAFGEFPREYLPLLSFSLMTLAGSILLWSRQEQIFSPCLVILFIMPVLFHFLSIYEIKRFPAGFLCSVLILIFILNSFLVFNRGKLTDELARDDLSKLTAVNTPGMMYLLNVSNREDAVAAIYPWDVYLKTRRPSGLLPVNLYPDRLRELCGEYGYDFVLDNAEGKKSYTFYEKIENEELEWLGAVQHKLWKVTGMNREGAVEHRE